MTDNEIVIYGVEELLKMDSIPAFVGPTVSQPVGLITTEGPNVTPPTTSFWFYFAVTILIAVICFALAVTCFDWYKTAYLQENKKDVPEDDYEEEELDLPEDEYYVPE